jgi:Tfp pilus assembly protein PilN
MADPSLISKTNINRAQSSYDEKGVKGIGVLMFLALLFFVVAGLVYGGMYFYRQNAEKTLDGLTIELAQLEEDLDSNNINEIARVDRGLATARSLLAQHVYTSKLFNLLEEYTLTRVYYTDFSYEFSAGGSVTVKGVADTFTALHQQLERLRGIPLITSVQLKDIQLTDEGTVVFTLDIVINENVFRFHVM